MDLLAARITVIDKNESAAVVHGGIATMTPAGGY